MSLPLSPAIKELIAKARIVSFASWESSHPAEAIQYFQVADDEGRYLSDEDCDRIQTLSPETSTLMPMVRQLREQAPEIVQEARAQVLATFPGIVEPGGDLYPEVRAEACWRDFWHFLRCITYGIAGHSPEYTSEEGLHYMQRLYQELHVPLEAMVLGLENIQRASLKRVNSEYQETLTPYFETLITQLKGFRGETA